MILICLLIVTMYYLKADTFAEGILSSASVRSLHPRASKYAPERQIFVKLYQRYTVQNGKLLVLNIVLSITDTFNGGYDLNVVWNIQYGKII